jgi:hypothetical protein
MKELYIISAFIICAGMIMAWKAGYEACKIDEEDKRQLNDSHPSE